MIITIDGPAGAGKSSIAKHLAQHLTDQATTAGADRTHKMFEYLDTGSMYRAVALLGVRSHIDWNNPSELERLTEEADIDVVDGRTYLNSEDVTEAVRQPDITETIRFAADNPVIRQKMVAVQRNIARRLVSSGKGLVTEGRDQGTAVFPDAHCKFFLTATPEERTRRRLSEWEQRGIVGNFDETRRQIIERDERDAARRVGPLCEPPDAHRIVSDDMTIEEVIAKICSLLAIV